MSKFPARVNVVVIGGGPGGHAAALAARQCGASVVLAEREMLGGQCVHHTCIPNALLLGAAGQFLDIQELAVAGVIDVGETFRLARAVSRREQLVSTMAGGVERSLRSAGVLLSIGRAALVGPEKVALEDGATAIEADAVVVATGARWEVPKVPGVPDRSVITLDEVTRMTRPPASALVLGGGPGETAFSVEAAVILATSGTAVTFAALGQQVVPSLDVEIDGALRANLETIGITVLTGSATSPSEAGVLVEHDGGRSTVEAEIVVAADDRAPNLKGVGLESVGADTDAWLEVDEGCRSRFPGVFGVGDVTGGAMLTSAASEMGRVAGANAAGANERVRLESLPHILHTSPGAAWVGRSERSAAAHGYDVTSTIVDLGASARAVTLGGREGYLKLVAERDLGQVLGMQIVGPDAAELVAVAAQAIHAELTVHDLASSVHWHPSAAESLSTAARQLKSKATQ